MSQRSNNLLFRPVDDCGLSGESLAIKPGSSDLQYLTFAVRKLVKGDTYSSQTGTNEMTIVLLGGCCSVESSLGSWPTFGGRRDVFDGLPHALYLPIHSSFTVRAEKNCEFALCSCPAEVAYPAHLITPDEIEVEVRGGENATRQINHLLKPEFAAQRLLIVEVYTPSGNWSSYPPHKHDVHNPPNEVDLEEIYFYKIDKPGGYAIQRVYTQDRTLDVTLTVHDSELVVIPEGYHPVVAAHGYNVYYLNVLAGSARSMAASDDPVYAWVRGSWKVKDPRVPLVKIGKGN